MVKVFMAKALLGTTEYCIPVGFFFSPDDQRYRYGQRGRESMCEQVRKSDCFDLKYMYICVFLYVKAFGLFPKLKNLTT